MGDDPKVLKSIKPEEWPERFYAGKAVVRFPNGVESGSWYSKPEERGEATREYVRADIAARAAITEAEEMTERIVAAAVQVGGLTISLPRPAGHGEVLALMSEEVNGFDPALAAALQGFVTSEGRFVSRVEALKIAHRAGQPFRDTPRPPNLFSEDLW